MRLKNKNQSGFTIIEVVLVLAIAGLIFLIVFIALPQLQASRRDQQRKTAAFTLMARMENRLRYPQNLADHNELLSDLAEPLFDDPQTGMPYDIPYRDSSANHSDIPDPGQIFYQVGHQCTETASDPVRDATSSPNSSFAVWIGLEVGQYICYDNSAD